MYLIDKTSPFCSQQEAGSAQRCESATDGNLAAKCFVHEDCRALQFLGQDNGF